MSKTRFVTVNVKPETKADLDKFRQMPVGTLKYDDAVRTLLKHWEKTH